MRPTRILHAITAAALIVTAWAGAPALHGQPTQRATTPVTRVMALGDSITAGRTAAGLTDGYRCELANRLRAAGVTIDYVGPLTNGTCPGGDTQHAGYSGWTISELQARAAEWVTAYQPDVVLLMAGTNDVLEHTDMGNMAARLGALIDTVRAARPDTVVIVSTIPQIGTSKWCCDAAQVAAWNAYRDALPSVAAGHGARLAGNERIYKRVLDTDAIHPKACAYALIAGNWYFAWATTFTPPAGRPWLPLWPAPNC